MLVQSLTSRCCFVIIIFIATNKSKIIELGNQRLFLDNSKTKLLTAFFEFSREIYLYDLFDQIFYEFKNYANKFKQISVTHATLLKFPQLLLEFALMVILIGLYVLLISEVLNEAELITGLMLLVSMSVRILPSINRIVSNYQQIIFSRSTKEKVKNYFKI